MCAAPIRRSNGTGSLILKTTLMHMGCQRPDVGKIVVKTPNFVGKFTLLRRFCLSFLHPVLVHARPEQFDDVSHKHL
jgi:hypothetical protein